MMGKHAKVIARIYTATRTPTPKTPMAMSYFTPRGTPVLLDEGAVRRLVQQRIAVVGEALKDVSLGPDDNLVVNGRELEPMKLQENGVSWKGHYYTDAQLAALEKVPRNILPPRQLADIKNLNAAVRSGAGTAKAIDYNPATREKGRTGKRKYASMGSKAYETVPFAFFINKEGGMGFDAFDIGLLERKLARWMDDPKIKSRLGAWSDDRAVMADIFKYIDNQRQGLPNSLHLDRDPVVAVQKRNLITDLLGGEAAKGALGESRLSTKSSRDNPWRSYRLDRLNQMTDSSGQNFPVHYDAVKQNLMPGGATKPLPGTESNPLRPGVTPTAVINHIKAQSTVDLSQGLITAGVPRALAQEIAQEAYSQSERVVRRKTAPHERAYAMRASELMASLGPDDLAAISQAMLKGGTKGAKEAAKTKLQLAASKRTRLRTKGG
jgi:hypothetical protein